MAIKTVTKLIREKDDFDELINGFKIHKLDFKFIFSSGKLTVLCDNLKFTYYPNKLGTVKGLYFVKKLKDYILNNEFNYNFNLKIKYMTFNLKLNESVYYTKDIYEIDLKGAYWYMFGKYFNIDKDIFEEGLKLDKRIRLMALGALAKNQMEFDYKEGELKSTLKIKSELTEGIFYKCAYETDLVMRNLINIIQKEFFMFYWVDAIFFRGKKNIDIISKELEKQNIKFKIVPIRNLIRTKEKITVEDFDFKRRDFNFKKLNVNKELL